MHAISIISLALLYASVVISQSFPSELTSLFQPGTAKLEINYNPNNPNDIANSGTRQSFATVSREPRILLGDSSGVQPALKYTVLGVSIDSSNNFKPLFLQEDLQLPQDGDLTFFFLTSQKAPVIDYSASTTGGMGFVLFLQVPGRGGLTNIPSTDDTIDILEFASNSLPGFTTAKVMDGVAFEVVGGGGGGVATTTQQTTQQQQTTTQRTTEQEQTTIIQQPPTTTTTTTEQQEFTTTQRQQTTTSSTLRQATFTTTEFPDETTTAEEEATSTQQVTSSASSRTGRSTVFQTTTLLVVGDSTATRGGGNFGGVVGSASATGSRAATTTTSNGSLFDNAASGLQASSLGLLLAAAAGVFATL